jgi:7,8-dihydropterin-6-yl-methyl-4-(beta-D-ribofuranosyl)aminobenzene 5'-phosphate synthase
VLRGIHLSGINERVIPATVEALREFDLTVTVADHCAS